MLHQFLKNAPEAARAVHVERLVKPKWSQHPNAYRMLSRISPDEEIRVKGVIG